MKEIRVTFRFSNEQSEKFEEFIKLYNELIYDYDLLTFYLTEENVFEHSLKYCFRDSFGDVDLVHEALNCLEYDLGLKNKEQYIEDIKNPFMKLMAECNLNRQ